MNCQKCGKDNPDDAQICEACSSPLGRTSANTESVKIKISVLAIASLVSGLLTLILLAATVVFKSMTPAIIMLVTAIDAVILGIVSLIQIGLSGGRITGRGPAIIGISIPSVLFLLAIELSIPHRLGGFSFRMTCGTNLSGIGKAMLIYANDYDNELPRAGGRSSIWGTPVAWDAPDRFSAFGLTPDGRGGQATISSSLYLLVKYAEVTPKSFICKTDTGTTEWKLSEQKPPRPDFGSIDAWDLGPEPQRHCSYAYHIPYSQYALTTSNNPGTAVAADRNPWIDSPFAKARDFNTFTADISDKGRNGNCSAHQLDGQTVLFLDSHADFEKRSFCGVKDDNIYTYWNGEDRKRGLPPVLGSQPADKLDSLLVNDPWTPTAKLQGIWRSRQSNP